MTTTTMTTTTVDPWVAVGAAAAAMQAQRAHWAQGRTGDVGEAAASAVLRGARARCSRAEVAVATQIQAGLSRALGRSLATDRPPPALSRGPIGRRAAALVAEIVAELAATEGRCSARRLSADAVLACIRRAAAEGAARDHAGRPANAYGYAYTLTSVAARRGGDTVRWDVHRSSRVVHAGADLGHAAPLCLVARVSLAPCLPGDVVAVRAVGRAHAAEWARYDAAGRATGAALGPLRDDDGDRWEHGATVAECRAEAARKRTARQLGRLGAAVEAVARAESAAVAVMGRAWPQPASSTSS